MRVLNTARVLHNMRLASRHLRQSSLGSLSDLKSAFLSAMNEAQGSSIRGHPARIHLEFNEPAISNFLMNRTVFSPSEMADPAHLFHSPEDQVATNLVRSALDLIRQADENLAFLVNQLIGTIALYRLPDRDGGSVSCAIGLIWLSPKEGWTVSYCAEMIVHEFVHNSVFLEDMVRGVMPRPDLLEHENALSVSAIRRTPRPYDKAFHSACVVVGIMYLYHCLDETQHARSFLPALRDTITDLLESDAAMQGLGLDVLTENGRQVLKELAEFALGTPKYDSIARSLRRVSAETSQLS